MKKKRLYEIATKKAKCYCEIINVLHILPGVPIALLLRQKLFSVTKTFVFGKQTLSQKLFSLTKFFSLTKTGFFLPETWTETCFCEANLFAEGYLLNDIFFWLKETFFRVIIFFFSDINFCLIETCFCVTLVSLFSSYA